MQFRNNRARLLYSNFLEYMGEILLQFWNLKKYFSFLQSYGSPFTSTWPHLRCDVGLEEGEYK